MNDLLLWIYVSNAILLIIHEIDSAYWKEWNLFGIYKTEKLPNNEKKGLTFFLLFHFPMLFAVLFGLIEVQKAHKPEISFP